MVLREGLVLRVLPEFCEPNFESLIESSDSDDRCHLSSKFLFYRCARLITHGVAHVSADLLISRSY